LPFYSKIEGVYDNEKIEEFQNNKVFNSKIDTKVMNDFRFDLII